MPEMMNAGDIAFPHLGIYLKNVPKQFTVFGFNIALYAIFIVIGVFLAVNLCERVAKRTGRDGDVYWDIYFPMVLVSVIGARIYYVIFSWDNYKNDLIRVFYIHEGGLAIYGGVIAGFLFVFFYAKWKKKKYLELADTIMFGLLVGQIIGRWGNFTNRECFGQYTDSLLAMRLPVDAVRAGEITDSIRAHMTAATNYIQVHPTFLYESCWNLLLLSFLLFYVKKKKFDGEITLFYLGGYGLGRFFVEGLRTDQLQLRNTGIAVSQVLGISLFIFATITEIVIRCRLKNAPVAVDEDAEEGLDKSSDEAPDTADDTAEDQKTEGPEEPVESGDAEGES